MCAPAFSSDSSCVTSHVYCFSFASSDIWCCMHHEEETLRLWCRAWVEMNQGKEGQIKKTVSEEQGSSWPHELSLALASSALTWSLEFCIDEGEQFLADAAVRNRPCQEAVVGAGCLQKEIWVWWEVWSLGMERGQQEERSRWERAHW
jgi:hypothetical protein